MLVAVIVPLAAFSPALWNGFVWDDHFNFVTNLGYRGLGPAQLHWMVTNTRLSHWIPVTWLTLGLDYAVWGMHPAGYHLTNLLLHAANGWLFFLVALRLIHLATPGAGTGSELAGATAASLFFSIHPLRVESVAWITERRDVLSGFFFLLAILAYLRAHEHPTGRARRWIAVSLASFQVGVLAKSIVITLPAVLLILDVYPLRRLDPRPARWLAAANRGIFTEKLPFLPMAVFGGFVATSIIGRANEFTSLSILERVTLAFYSFWFYVWKTLIPTALSALYELPEIRDPWEPRFAVAIAGSVAITALLLALVRRWPAGLAAWLCYLVIVGPVSGVKHTGVQLVADRYSYLSCLPWAVLFGGGVCAIIRARIAGTRTPVRFRAVSIGLVAWLGVLAFLTSQQTTIWRDTETLWRHAVTVDPHCYVCRHNLGTTLLDDGRTASAIDQLERAVALRPAAPFSHGTLVFAYLAIGAPGTAQHHLDALQRVDPGLARDLSALFIAGW